MTSVVPGIYKQGKLELLEEPVGLREGRVRVVLIDEEPPTPVAHYLTFGKYRAGRLSTLEDFQSAQWSVEAATITRPGRSAGAW